jgi:hypothetical protein
LDPNINHHISQYGDTGIPDLVAIRIPGILIKPLMNDMSVPIFESYFMHNICLKINAGLMKVFVKIESRNMNYNHSGGFLVISGQQLSFRSKSG